MKKFLIALFLLAFLIPSFAQATLITIGTAGYDSDASGSIDEGEYYNLIFEGELGSDGLVWLDYSKYGSQGYLVDWADALGASLTVSIDSAYTTSIDFRTGWRLPSAGTNPSTGINQTTSEMGYLFYDELGLDANTTTAAELNATNFDNLVASRYWTGTVSYPPIYYWYFQMSDGSQGDGSPYANYGLAVIGGQVSAADPVPEPATLLLLGAGIVGFVGARRNLKK